MAITTMDGLVAALGNADTLSWYKTTSTTTVAGYDISFYQLGGVPTLPSIPSSVGTFCTSTTGGAPTITKSSTDKVYVASVDLVTTALQTYTLNDRLYHCGSLVGNSSALQTFTVTSTVAMDAGCISTNTYTEWWMEGYTTLGSAASSCYFDVTYTDASTGVIAVTIASTFRQSRLLRILSSVTGKIIQSISGATLQVTTGTAGSWGVTVSRPLFTITPGLVNVGITYDFAQTGLAQISTLACLWWRAWQATTATGVLQANVKLVAG
jgi:hypothetical protein